MSCAFCEELRKHIRSSGYCLESEKIRPLALAYLGDTIFDLYVRSILVMTRPIGPKDMHIAASGIVNAASQARIVKLMLPVLTEEEMAVYKAARNQKPQSLPKNMSPVDYKLATGLEALLGHLFITGQDKRLMELLEMSVGIINRKDQL